MKVSNRKGQRKSLLNLVVDNASHIDLSRITDGYVASGFAVLLSLQPIKRPDHRAFGTIQKWHWGLLRLFYTPFNRHRRSVAMTGFKWLLTKQCALNDEAGQMEHSTLCLAELMAG